MRRSTKIWVGVGAFLVTAPGATGAPIATTSGQPTVAAAPVTTPLTTETRPAAPSALLFAAAGGEGEGGEQGTVPETYALGSTDPNAFKYEAKTEIAAYAAHVHAAYAAAAGDARSLKGAIDAFLDKPSQATLDAARGAWLAARPSYLVTEAFRFYDGPIEENEGRINAWPMNEAFVDYVRGKAKAGIVNDPKVELTIAAINERDQQTDESDVTTGWHAIEFLLWGQDLDRNGPGARPFTDYVPGKGNNDRRRAYLTLVTDQLVGDLEALVKAWAPDTPDTYAAKFLALPEREAIGRIFNGMAILAGFELKSERLATALDSGEQEDEHSCFSDNTNADFIYDLEGIRQVYLGGPARPGMSAIVARLDADLDKRMRALLDDARAKIAVLDKPFDSILRTNAGSPARKRAEAAVAALTALGGGLSDAGAKLGVLVLIPTAAD